MIFMKPRFRVGILIMAGIMLSIIAALVIIQPEFISGNATMSSYDPAYYGLPEIVGGYRVLVVETSENTACRHADSSKRLILQAPQPSLEGFLAAADVNAIYQELEAVGFNRDDFSEFSFVGPGITREQIISANQFRLHQPCPRPLGGPIGDFTPNQVRIVPADISENNIFSIRPQAERFAG